MYFAVFISNTHKFTFNIFLPRSYFPYFVRPFNVVFLRVSTVLFHLIPYFIPQLYKLLPQSFWSLASKETVYVCIISNLMYIITLKIARFFYFLRRIAANCKIKYVTIVNFSSTYKLNVWFLYFYCEVPLEIGDFF